MKHILIGATFCMMLAGMVALAADTPATKPGDIVAPMASAVVVPEPGSRLAARARGSPASRI